MTHRQIGWPLCFAVMLLAAGCGPNLYDVPETLEVTGTVTHNANPLTGATVMFFDGLEYTAIGVTDNAGKFRLKTRFNSEVTRDGAPPREYRVTISKSVPPRGMTEEQYQARKDALKMKREEGQIITPADQVPPLEQTIPPKYSSSLKTELSVTVMPGQDNNFVFPLEF